MYIGIKKFSESTSDHKPLDVFRIQQEVAYIFYYITWYGYYYVSQVYFNVTN